MSLAVSKQRCPWVGTDPLYVNYHDREWGVPIHDDNKLFEFIILEGAQAGLSWYTVLKKRESYRNAFSGFNPAVVASFTDKDLLQLLQNESIIRNRLKLKAAITNAQKFLAIQKEFGSFDMYQWQFVDGKPLQNSWHSLSELPALSPQAAAFSDSLKQRGFKFVGPTIMYSHMQATGMVNDHMIDCFRYSQVKKLAKRDYL